MISEDYASQVCDAAVITLANFYISLTTERTNILCAVFDKESMVIIPIHRDEEVLKRRAANVGVVTFNDYSDELSQVEVRYAVNKSNVYRYEPVEFVACCVTRLGSIEHKPPINLYVAFVSVDGMEVKE